MKPHCLSRLGALLLASALLTNCAENPADNVEKAKVEDVSESTPAPPEPPTPVEKVTFVFSESSRIEFVGSKVTGSHSGGFGNFVGKFEIAGDQLSSRGTHTVTIDMASVYSDDEKLTGHLKSEDFFDVATYPTARFRLSKATPLGEDKYELTGTLDLHGVEKEITFPATVKVSGDNTIVDFNAEFAINRKDFGIEYPGKSDDLIRDEVVLKFQVSAKPGEPRDLVLAGGPGASTEGATAAEARPERPDGPRGEGQRPDWRNMSPEEREERRRQFIAEADKNGDGNLGKDEVPERMWEFMSRADKNGDDQITEAERTEYRAERETERMMRELSGEEPEGFGDGRRRGPGGGPGGFGRGDGKGKGDGKGQGKGPETQQ